MKTTTINHESLQFIFRGENTPQNLGLLELLDGGTPIEDNEVEMEFVGVFDMEQKKFIDEGDFSLVFRSGDSGEITFNIFTILLENGSPKDEEGEPMEFLRAEICEE